MSRQALLTMSFVTALCVLGTLSIQARATGQDGMIAVRDQQTGKLRAPTADEIKALRAATPPGSAAMTAGRPAAQASVMTRRDGARGVRVAESNMVFEVVTRDADGKLSSQCVQGAGPAAAALSHPIHAADQESAHESR